MNNKYAKHELNIVYFAEDEAFAEVIATSLTEGDEELKIITMSLPEDDEPAGTDE